MLFINMQKYMKDYDRNKESSYCKYWDKDFIENYNEDSDEVYFLEFDFQCP